MNAKKWEVKPIAKNTKEIELQVLTCKSILAAIIPESIAIKTNAKGVVLIENFKCSEFVLASISSGIYNLLDLNVSL